MTVADPELDEDGSLTHVVGLVRDVPDFPGPGIHRIIFRESPRTPQPRAARSAGFSYSAPASCSGAPPAAAGAGAKWPGSATAARSTSVSASSVSTISSSRTRISA